MIAKNKELQYAEKIKDYSENMLKYELDETKTNIEAELLFGRADADKKLLKRLEDQMQIIESEIYIRQSEKLIEDDKKRQSKTVQSPRR